MNLPMAACWLLAGILVSLCWILLFVAIGYVISDFLSYTTANATTTNSPFHFTKATT